MRTRTVVLSVIAALSVSCAAVAEGQTDSSGGYLRVQWDKKLLPGFMEHAIMCIPAGSMRIVPKVLDVSFWQTEDQPAQGFKKGMAGRVFDMCHRSILHHPDFA